MGGGETCAAEYTEMQLRSSRPLVQIVELMPGSLLHVLTTDRTNNWF